MPDDQGVPHDRVPSGGVPSDRTPHEPDDEPVTNQARRDEFADLVLDESFVRGGAYEAPARTRLAVARYGGKQTSWRHGGGLPHRRADERSLPTQREPRRRGRFSTSPGATTWPRLREKLPIIVTVVVVGAFAFLMFS